ncbi:polysaccharide deacetylase [Gottschalkia purinilytica]|uniref:Polysaccharide deacetylase n=1 Tax=Gottschalkia purinilytica TaxID=1503 RepID=A0A0L0WFC0_GOTPU|nr:polysaccharide deacetylase family protein [Gottschalkia purinilytica]KNF10164.1 polysaccharide deacetylase [Gottschalkia purinilytica]
MTEKAKIAITTIVFVIIFGIFSFKYREKNKEGQYIPVLMYHNVLPNPDKAKINYSMKPELFEKHMRILKERGYNTVTVTELYDYFYNKRSLPSNPILITLDDGKMNNYDYAYPIFKKLNMKGSMFVIGHTLKEKGNGEYLTWDKIREMNKSGLIDIQSHTFDLHHLIDREYAIFHKNPNENDEDYRKRIIEDFKSSKKLIENNTKKEVVGLAYPYGKYNENIEKMAKAAGYKLTFSTKLGVLDKQGSPYSINRINIDGRCSTTRLLIEIKFFKILKFLKSII